MKCLFKKIPTVSTHNARLVAILFVVTAVTPITMQFAGGFPTVQPSVAHANAVTSLLGIDALMQWMLSWVGSFLISLAALLLSWSGSLFDVLMDWTILNFAAHMGAGEGAITGLGIITGTGTGAVEIVWKAFRDLANIAVIVMFIFVAVSTILGIDEFGYKKYIARLLIVSILINFSMFFAKISIDVSNALANTIYTVMKQSIVSQDGTPVTGTADAFIKAVGATRDLSSLKTQQLALSKVADGSDSNFSILWVTMGLFLILTMLAVVLFYGSALLMMRGVLLIFLIASSAFAFASFMVPGLRDHTYGWKGWKDNLIRSTLFAPLIMIGLWMVLFLMNSVRAPLKQNVAGFANNPGDPSAWTAFIVYVVGTGLLYLAMNLAKSFSSNISIMSSSFNFANGTASAGKSAALFTRNRARFVSSERAQRFLATDGKDKLIARANAGGVGGYAAQIQLNRLQKQAKGEFGGATAAVTKKLDSFAKTFTQGAGKGGAAARAIEHDKHEIEKIEKGITAVGPSKEAEKKVLETGMQEAKSAIKAEYQKALDDHKANNQALKDSEAEVERDEKEIETITKKVTEGSASAQDIAKKNALALNVKAVASKIAMTKAAINADREAQKGTKSFGEAIDEHVEKTMDQTHGKVIQDSLKRAKSKIEDMKNENRDLYLTRSVSNPVRRDQMRSALKSSADEKKLKAAAKAFAKLSGAAEPAPQATPATPAAGTPAANPPARP